MVTRTGIHLDVSADSIFNALSSLAVFNTINEQ